MIRDHLEIDRLACPSCGNQDPSAIVLFAETLETDRYSFDRIENGVPVFGFGKSVHTDPAPDPPSAECSRCRARWIPPLGSYEFH